MFRWHRPTTSIGRSPAARAATEEMRHWSAFERAELCLRAYEIWQDRVEDIARILTMEQGKPFKAEAIEDIAESGDYLHIAAEDAKRMKGELIPTTERNRRMFTVRRPVGIWAAITPWNFPVMIPMETVGPGLATGNAVIVKPPLNTCWAMLEAARAIEEAGFPKGALSVIPGDREVGEHLVTHPGIDGISFTGSSETGKRIIAAMGLKRTIMEMSGNGPLIVAGDADVEAAAIAAVYGAYYNAGQVCTATERVIVVRPGPRRLRRSDPESGPTGAAWRPVSPTTPPWARSTTSPPPPRWIGTSRTPSSVGPRFSSAEAGRVDTRPISTTS